MLTRFYKILWRDPPLLLALGKKVPYGLNDQDHRGGSVRERTEASAVLTPTLMSNCWTISL